jgi:head-tail adaptor
MRAGRLTQRVTLSQPGELDSYGERTLDPGVETWASVEDVVAKDVANSLGVSPETEIVVRLRYREDVDSRTVVTWSGTAYRVLQVKPDTRKVQTVLLCKALE